MDFILLIVTDKRQTRPLVREGADMDRTVTVERKRIWFDTKTG
jgi:hypothetical protein